MFGIMWFRKIKRATGDEDKDFVTILHNPDGSVHVFPDVTSAGRFAAENKFKDEMKVVCLDVVQV